jgi:hypothetical protein
MPSIDMRSPLGRDICRMSPSPSAFASMMWARPGARQEHPVRCFL